MEKPLLCILSGRRTEHGHWLSEVELKKLPIIFINCGTMVQLVDPPFHSSSDLGSILSSAVVSVDIDTLPPGFLQSA